MKCKKKKQQNKMTYDEFLLYLEYTHGTTYKNSKENIKKYERYKTKTDS